MQLIYAAASPFARKVRVLAAETGLLDRIELLDTAVMPTTLNERVNALNPLGKIPVLLTDDDEALYDSRVICEFADHPAVVQCLIVIGQQHRNLAQRIESIDPLVERGRHYGSVEQFDSVQQAGFRGQHANLAGEG